jgi:hypothetical protein
MEFLPLQARRLTEEKGGAQIADAASQTFIAPKFRHRMRTFFKKIFGNSVMFQ